MIPPSPLPGLVLSLKGPGWLIKSSVSNFTIGNATEGGQAEKIYVGTLAESVFTEITPYEGKDAFPMWAEDGRIYFVTTVGGVRTLHP